MELAVDMFSIDVLSDGVCIANFTRPRRKVPLDRRGAGPHQKYSLPISHGEAGRTCGCDHFVANAGFGPVSGGLGKVGGGFRSEFGTWDVPLADEQRGFW